LCPLQPSLKPRRDPPPSPLQLGRAPRRPDRRRSGPDRSRQCIRPRVRDSGRKSALGRLRRPRRAAAAEARADARVHVRHRQAGGGAQKWSRNGLLRPQLQQPRRDADGAGRSGAGPGARRPALRLRGLGDGLPDAVDRPERALRRPDADPMDDDDRPVPREHACARPAAEGAWGVSRRDDREPALHGWRCSSVVARPGRVGTADPAGLLHVAERAAAARARADPGEPDDAKRDATSGSRRAGSRSSSSSSPRRAPGDARDCSRGRSGSRS